MSSNFLQAFSGIKHIRNLGHFKTRVQLEFLFENINFPEELNCFIWHRLTCYENINSDWTYMCIEYHA